METKYRLVYQRMSYGPYKIQLEWSSEMVPYRQTKRSIVASGDAHTIHIQKPHGEKRGSFKYKPQIKAQRQMESSVIKSYPLAKVFHLDFFK